MRTLLFSSILLALPFTTGCGGCNRYSNDQINQMFQDEHGKVQRAFTDQARNINRNTAANTRQDAEIAAIKKRSAELDAENERLRGTLTMNDIGEGLTNFRMMVGAGKELGIIEDDCCCGKASCCECWSENAHSAGGNKSDFNINLVTPETPEITTQAPRVDEIEKRVKAVEKDTNDTAKTAEDIKKMLAEMQPNNGSSASSSPSGNSLQRIP